MLIKKLVTECTQQMINCDKKSRKIFCKSFGMFLKCSKLHQIICDNAATTKHIKICFICKIKDNKKLGMAKKKVRILPRSQFKMPNKKLILFGISLLYSFINFVIFRQLMFTFCIFATINPFIT